MTPPTDGTGRAATRRTPLGLFDELLGRRVSMRALALVRIFVGPVALLHLRPFLERAGDGVIYRDSFHDPYLTLYPDLPRSLYVAVLVIGAVAAVTTSVGLLTRVSTVTLFAVVTYNVFLSATHYHHNRGYLIVVLAALAVAPCGRELSVDSWWRRRRRLTRLPVRAPAWPLWLLRFEVSVVYVASGFSKLVDPDWIGGTVTWGRVVSVEERIVAESPLPSWAVDVLTDRTFHSVAAPVIVLTELVIGLGFWSRHTRYVAVWVAVVFHLSIELSASVQVFSYLALAVLPVWAVPATRDRVLVVDHSTSSGRRLSSAVRRLDWLARFRVESADDGRAPRVIDRDGSQLTGTPATLFVFSRLVPTAWFALPFLLLPSVRRARQRTHQVPLHT